jgi:hypothetical protein
MIEGVDETQALIEELLRFGIMRRDAMVQVSQSGHQLDGIRRCMGTMILR